MDQDGIIAIGLLTRRDLDTLGPAFKWAWPVDEVKDSAAFEQLLIAIDEAEEQARAHHAPGMAVREPRSRPGAG